MGVPAHTGTPPFLERAMSKKDRQRGQAIVEFAILTPAIFLFIFIIVDMGIGLSHYVVLTNAAREGARYAAAGAPSDSGCSQASVVDRVRCKTLAHAQNLISDPQKIDVAFIDRNSNGQVDPGDSVVIRIHYSYKLITALGLSNRIGWLRWPGIQPLTMNSCEDMRLEQVTSDAKITPLATPCS